MSKRLLVAAIIGAIALTVAPAMQANATGEGGATAVVAVFTGNATVADANGDGLCIPGDAPGCVGPEIADYTLTIPGNPAPAPAVCQAAGVFETVTVNGACELVANGVVDGVTTSKPSCGNSTGTSSGTNTTTLGGTTRNVKNGWITSAGGTIPVTGYVDDADADTDAEGDGVGPGEDDHNLVALVQARPITPTGTIACVTADANTFIVGGIAVVA